MQMHAIFIKLYIERSTNPILINLKQFLNNLFNIIPSQKTAVLIL